MHDTYDSFELFLDAGGRVSFGHNEYNNKNTAGCTLSILVFLLLSVSA